MYVCQKNRMYRMYVKKMMRVRFPSGTWIHTSHRCRFAYAQHKLLFHTNQSHNSHPIFCFFVGLRTEAIDNHKTKIECNVYWLQSITPLTNRHTKQRVVAYAGLHRSQVLDPSLRKANAKTSRYPHSSSLPKFQLEQFPSFAMLIVMSKCQWPLA